MTKVLIVDDSQMVRKVIAKILWKHECEIFEAANSSKTIEKIKENDPDIVFLDIVMDTNRSGIDLLIAIKKYNPNIKVVMVTSLSHQDQIIKECVDAGADEYISKPFKEHEILAAFDNYA
ncbi:MAG: response regulator [Candidatus Woesearchaeota archaeon]